jgi:CDP-diacylglycerol--glycerol-3-phosphate 3-phosphatidyltransferase
MAEIGMRATVRVAFLGKLKTGMQMVALVVLILQHEKDAEALRLYHIGEGLLVIAGILTIWSGLYYLRAAWPALRGDDPVLKKPQQDRQTLDDPVTRLECAAPMRE